MGTSAFGAFRAYAHRGGSHESPENSLAAFRHATALGFAYLETDIRPTRDGVAMVHHDAHLERTTDGRGLVRDRTWQEMRSVRLSDGTTPLRLEELLEEFPDAHLTVDAKETGSVVALIDAVRRSSASDRVCVSSFSARRLIRARRLLPPGTESSAHPWEVLALSASPSRLPRPRLVTRSVVGMCHPEASFDRRTPPVDRAGTGERVRGRVCRCSPLALPRAHRVQVPLRALGLPLMGPGFVTRAHRQGLAVDVWTVDDASDMHRLLDMGVDGIMTDSPSVLRAVLESRAQWPSVR
ncbi:MAG: hypothetical protein RJA51_1417 [Actinomycetota bacterium]